MTSLPEIRWPGSPLKDGEARWLDINLPVGHHATLGLKVHEDSGRCGMRMTCVRCGGYEWHDLYCPVCEWCASEYAIFADDYERERKDATTT